MLHLITGSNGTGKTLFTLKEVRERQLKDNRPVYHNGRFTLTAEGESFGWQKIDFQDWQSCPDGAIFLIDECHNDMPKISAGAAVPPHIQALGEHRRRGFDFYLITQHPQNVSTFVRKLIGAPGWHRHLKRNFGADLVSQLEWSYVNDACEKPGAGKNGTVTMRAFPKEVYNWYSSAVLHTGKKTIPRQIWIIAGAVLLVPVLGFAAYRAMMLSSDRAKSAASAPVVAPVQTVPVAHGLSRDEWLAASVPRINGLPSTAPKYDDVTKPVDAPYPAACLETKRRCECYTQQATLMTLPVDLCHMIVQRGYFMDWSSPSIQASIKHASDVQARLDAAAAREAAARAQKTAAAVPGAPGASAAGAPGAAAGTQVAQLTPALNSLIAPPLVTSDPPPDPNAQQDAEVRQFIRRRTGK